MYVRNSISDHHDRLVFLGSGYSVNYADNSLPCFGIYVRYLQKCVGGGVIFIFALMLCENWVLWVCKSIHLGKSADQTTKF